MTVSCITKLNLGLNPVLTKTGGYGEIATDPISVQDVRSWATGTGLDQADRAWGLGPTPLDGGAVATLDLTSGLTDTFGAAFTPARVKAMYVRNAGSFDLTLGGNNGIVPSALVLKPGGAVLIVAPDATGYVVDGSHKTITLTNNGGVGQANAYSIVLVGASA